MADPDTSGQCAICGANHSHKDATPHHNALQRNAGKHGFEELFNSLLCVIPLGMVARSKKDLETVFCGDWEDVCSITWCYVTDQCMLPDKGLGW